MVDIFSFQRFKYLSTGTFQINQELQRLQQQLQLRLLQQQLQSH